MNELKSFLIKQADEAEEALSAIVLVSKPQKTSAIDSFLDIFGLIQAKISFFVQGDPAHTAGMLIELIEYLTKKDPEFAQAWQSLMKLKKGTNEKAISNH